MAEAMTTPKNSKAQVLCNDRFVFVGIATCCYFIGTSSLMLDANGHYNHSMLMLVMVGISGGFIHGVGFIPRFWLWKWLFSPYIAWPLMILGYYILIGN